MKTTQTYGTVLVSGASGALGGALALGLARSGAAGLALLCGRDEARAREVEKQCVQAGARAIVCRAADVRDRGELDRAFAGISVKFPDGLNAALLCAGATRDATVAAMSAGQWDEVLETNLTGAWNVLARVAALMPRGGNILVAGSVRGFSGGRGQANYAASKAGLIGLVRSAALELGSRDIRVNLVLPGLIESEMTAGLDLAAMSAQSCLGRPNTTDEIVRSMLFISSTKNISGQTFCLDSRIF